MSEDRPEKEVTIEPKAAGEGELYTSPPETVDAVKPDVREEVLEAADVEPSMPLIRHPVEPPLVGGLEPLEPLEPYSGDEYADRIGDALDPSRLMPSLMPTGVEPVGEVAPRLRGFTSQALPMQFTCPYGLDGRCCGCRYLPCNELTLAVLRYVSRDYEPGGRCSAD